MRSLHIAGLLIIPWNPDHACTCCFRDSSAPVVEWGSDNVASSLIAEAISPSFKITDFTVVSTEDRWPSMPSLLFKMLSMPCGLHAVPVFVASGKFEGLKVRIVVGGVVPIGGVSIVAVVTAAATWTVSAIEGPSINHQLLSKG